MKKEVSIDVANIMHFEMFDSKLLNLTNRVEGSIENQMDESCGPMSIVNKAAEIKTRIRIMEAEYKEIESLLIGAIDVNGGEINCDLGRFTLCKKNGYRFSDEILKLEGQISSIKSKIKAKKIIEIAAGAEKISSEYSIRFNPILPGINDEE